MRRGAARRPPPGPRPPTPHPSGARPPVLAADQVPRHVAVVMDGNGRWAEQRGLPRTAGHAAGEAALFDCVQGALELGVGWLSAYAFSTENWRRSPEEVRFLMGFNADVLRRRRDEMHELGVRVRWAGRRPRLWRRVVRELETAEELTRDNDRMTLVMCVNYGGRAEVVDAAAALAREAVAGRVDPSRLGEASFARHLDEPDMPDVDLFWRSSGEQRTSNFLLWQAAYAELVFSDVLWPDVDRRHLWAACEQYAARERRRGTAVDRVRAGEVPAVPAAPAPGAVGASAGGPRPVLHHVQVTVAPGRAQACVPFYELLGLRRVAPSTGVRPTGAWLALPGGDVQVHLSERADAARHAEQHLALVVEDLPALSARLSAAGHRVEGRAAVGRSDRALTRDPEGNAVELLSDAEGFTPS